MLRRADNAYRVAKNNTVKLDAALEKRVEQAMKVEGSTVFAEWARQAFTERCRRVESQLFKDNPEEYHRIYGKGK